LAAKAEFLTAGDDPQQSQPRVL